MNKNGFTLVELLAVIVILAIIFAIAVPEISNLISNSKKNAFESNGKLIFSSIRLKGLENSSFNPVNVDETNVKSIINIDDSNIKKLSFTMIGTDLYMILIGKNKWDNFSVYGTFNNLVSTEGLSLWLDAGNAASYPGTGTIWYDLSGNGNNATLLNGVAYDSNNMGTLLLDGIDDYAVGNISGFTNGQGFTSITWFKLSRINKEQHLTNLKGNVQFYASVSNKLGTSSYGYLFGTTTINAGTWYMAAMTKKTSGEAALYLNGVLESTGTLPSYGNASQYYVGEFVGGGDYYLKGNIAISQIYNKDLSQNEIQQIFNATKMRFGL